MAREYKRKKRPVGRQGRAVMFHMDEALHEALERHMGTIEPRTTRTALIEMLVARYLAERGLWPVASRAPEG